MPSYSEGPPIFRTAMGVAVRVYAVAPCFAKRHEYTLGSRLPDLTMEVVMRMARCIHRVDRARRRPVLCDRVNETKVLIAGLVERGLARGHAVALEAPTACNVKRRRLAFVFERPLPDAQKPKETR